MLKLKTGNTYKLQHIVDGWVMNGTFLYNIIWKQLCFSKLFVIDYFSFLLL